MTNKIIDFQNSINIKFNKPDLLVRSLIHKSFNSSINNEKLEFLGDRVLGLIISQKLITIYPEEKEGIIDKKYANLVNKKTCAKIANIINLKKYMSLGASYISLKRSDETIMSDCIEALIGAIFLDSGLKTVERFILKYWKTFIEDSELTLIDSKTKLQEYSLKKYKTLPKYYFKKQSGPHHDPIFNVEVEITESKRFSAKGNSKKSAQQNAAKKLLNALNVK